MRLFHQGQFVGRKKRIAPHLVRAPDEAVDEKLAAFYERLLAVLRRPTLRDGHWRLLESARAWEDNWTAECVLGFAWQGAATERILVVVNYAANQSQCYLRLPFADLAGAAWRLHDELNDVTYERDGNDLLARGLYVDLRPWQAHVFSVQRP
jgi:hypothetical protein